MKNFKNIYLSLLALLAFATSKAGSPPATIVGACGTAVTTYTLNPATDDMVWNDGNTYTVTKSFVVPAGETLEIRYGTVLEFVEGAEIIVEAGAYLYLRGTNTHLTSCNSSKFWKGITIKGVDSLSQTTTNQGKIYFYRATISNAEHAIRQDPNNPGGIIEAIEANFINNQNALKFQNYTAFNSVSFAKECTFKIDSNTVYEVSVGSCNERKIGTQVSITSVNGVQIIGCEFLNHYNIDHNKDAVYADPGTLGSAIYCFNSAVTIEPVNDIVESPCDYPEGTRNSFYGWYHGIYVGYSTPSTDVVDIIGADFTNNLYGVYLEKAGENTVLDCDIDLDDELSYIMKIQDCDGHTTDAEFYGIYIKGKSTSVKVMSNTYDVDLTENFGLHYGFLWDGPAGAYVPSNFEIKGNSFTFRIDTTVSGYVAAECKAVTIQDYKVAGTIEMSCNSFDLYAGLGTGVAQFNLYDLFYANQNGAVTMKPSSSSPRNEWTNYGGTCYSHGTTPVQVGYNIYADGSVTYAYDGSVDNPTCNGGSPTLSSKSLGASCATWDYCSEYEEAPPSTSGIFDVQGAEPIVLYPNPGSNYVNIYGVNTNAQVSILSIDGKEVTSKISVVPDGYRIDISNLTPGLYSVRIVSENATVEVKKFVKQ